MTEITENIRFVCRRDTAANWVIFGDDVLKNGEWGIETDTGRAKIGNGVDPYRVLDYTIAGPIDIASLVNGSLLVWNSTRGLFEALAADVKTFVIGATFDAGASGSLAAGAECDVYIPYGFTITEWRAIANAGVGAVEIDIEVCAYAGFPGSLASITASAPITIPPGESKNADIVLTGWTKTFVGPQIARFHVNTAAGVERVLIELIARKG